MPINWHTPSTSRRAILTCNAKDFAPLAKTWWQDGRQHYDIIASEQLPLGEMLRRVLRMLDSVSADVIENNLPQSGRVHRPDLASITSGLP